MSEDHKAKPAVDPARRQAIRTRLEGLIAPKQLQSITGDFGFLPISNRMSPVYRRGAEAIRAYLRAPERDIPDLDRIGDCKGIFTRVAKQDQWDWATVQAALNIERNTARRISSTLAGLRATLKDGGDPSALLTTLQELGTSAYLGRLLRHLDAAHEGLGDGAKSAPENRADNADGAANTRPSGGHRHLNLAALRAARENHEHLVAELSRLFRDHGFQPEESVHVDLFVQLKWAPAIFEVKTLTASNETAQMRKAVAQLLEYRFRYGQDKAALWILYASAPQDRMMLVDFPRSLGLYVTWAGGEGFEGPDGDKLLTNFRASGTYDTTGAS
ncbi:hypothetical protein CKO28_01235 [Rhodovibrio sodomensis]|uniref:Restriction endonuclease n=1 Tax=Rhodovibrio sodomensis TaxID=1088 RepID=A0ABS1D9M6_9PROT|nr:hypothetical protein [Rhodovibrio sodomensis]MBK1666667.1 hypothetical protein [Rhodovibrio sodomensis]